MTTETDTSSPMPKLTFITGGALVVVAAIGSAITGFASFTSWIPAIIGALLIICGLIALKKLMLGIHIALLLAVVGALGMLQPIIGGIADFTVPAVTALTSMILLVIYVGLGVRSFIQARRWKKA